MEVSSLGIPLGFILLAAVLCWQLISERRVRGPSARDAVDTAVRHGRWWLKLITIVCVPAYGLAVWISMSSYKGWPTASSPPNKALLYSVLIQEPEPGKGPETGAIYIWLRTVEGDLSNNPLDYTPERTEPRAFKLPYSRSLHKAAEMAMEKMREGKAVIFGETDDEGKPGAPGEKDGSGNGDGMQGGALQPLGPAQYEPESERGDFGFYELPIPDLDEKERTH